MSLINFSSIQSNLMSNQSIYSTYWFSSIKWSKLIFSPINFNSIQYENESISISNPFFVKLKYAGPEIRWVDGQKPLFTVQMELVSTVTAQDQHLHNFFQHMAKLNDANLQNRSFISLLPSPSPNDSDVKNPSVVLQDGSRELSKLVKVS